MIIVGLLSAELELSDVLVCISSET